MDMRTGILQRRSFAQHMLSSRSGGFIPKYVPKKLAIRKGKAVLVPRRRGFIVVDAMDVTKRQPILYCRINEDLVMEIAGKEGLMEELIKTLHAMYDAQYKFVKDHEIKRVPEDTGKLRRSFMRSMTRHYQSINDGEVFMEFGSGIPYLIWVNEMETYPKSGIMGSLTGKHQAGTGPHLRHPPYVGKYKVGKNGTTLHDPWALNHFFQWVVFQAHLNAHKAVEDAIVALFNRRRTDYNWGNSWYAARRFFKYKKSNPRWGWGVV